MGLDIGKARIGVALTDPLGYTAQPLLTVWRKSHAEDLRNLTRLIRANNVTAIVVGNPLHMSGEPSAWGRKVQLFAEALRQRSGVPMHLWDERLSSVAAHEILDEAGHDPRDRKAIIDQVAAVLILQDWMASDARSAALTATSEQA